MCPFRFAGTISLLPSEELDQEQFCKSYHCFRVSKLIFVLLFSNLLGNSEVELAFLYVFRCTTNALNGTDVQGRILLCFPGQNGIIPRAIFEHASQFVMNNGGSGLIFAQYTTDILTDTICQGIACVLVDIETATKIYNYWTATMYV